MNTRQEYTNYFVFLPNRPFQAKLPCAVPGLSLSRWYRKSGSLKVNCSGMAVRLNANVLYGQYFFRDVSQFPILENNQLTTIAVLIIIPHEEL